MTHPDHSIPYGFCHCGCGQPAPIATRANRSRGYVVGQPHRFLSGHNNKFRIEDRITVDSDTGCHLWTGTLLDGYARALIDRRLTLIHRYLWEQANGPVPDRHQLHHRCRNKRCVNVEHLELLSVTDHMREHSPLSLEQVAEIRSLHGKMSRADIAKKFGIAIHTVSAIHGGRAWV